MSEDREGYGVGSACTDASCALQLAVGDVLDKQAHLAADNRALRIELAGVLEQLRRVAQTSVMQMHELTALRQENTVLWGFLGSPRRDDDAS